VDCKERLQGYLRENEVPFEAQHHPRAVTAQEVAVCSSASEPACPITWRSGSRSNTHARLSRKQACTSTTKTLFIAASASFF